MNINTVCNTTSNSLNTIVHIYHTHPETPDDSYLSLSCLISVVTGLAFSIAIDQKTTHIFKKNFFPLQLQNDGGFGASAYNVEKVRWRRGATQCLAA